MVLIKLKLAETIGKSYSWIQENVTPAELRLWQTYWIFQKKRQDGIPDRPASLEKQEASVKGIARAFGAKVVKRKRGT